MSKRIGRVLDWLSEEMSKEDKDELIPFEGILEIFSEKPELFLRNIFQYFQNMVDYYVPEGVNEFQSDTESIGFMDYDMDRLFVHGVDVPFFPDRLFKNRFMQAVSSLGTNIGQNKVYIFDGPHGCGKSTCINNFLKKLEEYSLSDEGARYEIVWRLDSKALGSYSDLNKVRKVGDDRDMLDINKPEILEIACPNHCNPLLIIPLSQRQKLLEDLVKNEKLLDKVKSQKEYKWFFKDCACTICQSIAKELMNKGVSSEDMLKMLFARRYKLKRKRGIGIIVNNPSDEGFGREVVKNSTAQFLLNCLLGSSDQARLEYAKYADSNNGVFVLMDIKDKNVKRLGDLHNVLSEGYCRVGRREENIDTFFIAAFNPEFDREDARKKEEGINNDLSFADRKYQILINYVLGYDTEVRILEHFFGAELRKRFLPRVLENFAKIIISSRMIQNTDAMLQWIGAKDKYIKYCDRDLLLLKMEIYQGNIPEWLSEEDVSSFTAKVRRSIIEDSGKEGKGGFSGRKSLEIFQNLVQSYPVEDGLISMDKLVKFFTKQNGDLSVDIPNGFLDSLTKLYDYSVLQEVKEALFNYNVGQLKREIKNYLYATNFKMGDRIKCRYTGDELVVSEELFGNLETLLHGGKASEKVKQLSRDGVQRDVVQQMAICEDIEETERFKSMLRTYTRVLHQKILDPFIENDNFRKAIIAFGQDEYKTFDVKLRRDIDHMMQVLVAKFGYSEIGAKEVCVYVIEKDLAIKFADNYRR